MKFFSNKVGKCNFYFEKLFCFDRVVVLFSIMNRKIHIKFLYWIGLDSNALFRVDKIVEKKNQINECIIQVRAHINRYV